MKTPILIAALFSLLFLGCPDQTDRTDKKMRLWFKWGTALTLPESAVCVAGKNNSLYLSDIYLKLQIPPSFKATLDKELRTMDRKPNFDLPENMESWPHWDVAGRDVIFYEKTTGSVDRGGFVSQIAFEEASGTIFCHIVEYAP